MEPTNILPLLDELDKKRESAKKDFTIESAAYYNALYDAYPQLASELRRATDCILELDKNNIHLNTYVRQIMIRHGFGNPIWEHEINQLAADHGLPGGNNDLLRRALKVVEAFREFGLHSGKRRNEWRAERDQILKDNGF